MLKAFAGGAVAIIIGLLLIGGGFSDRDGDQVRCGKLLMKPHQTCKADGKLRTYEEQRKATTNDWALKAGGGALLVVGGIAFGANNARKLRGLQRQG